MSLGKVVKKEQLVGKLRATIVVEWEVTDLAHYNAADMEGAAALTRKQLEDGSIDHIELASWGTLQSVTVEAEKVGSP